METEIDKLLQEIRLLPPDDQERLRQALDEEAAPSGEREELSAEEEFKRRLVRAGLLKTIKSPVTDLTSYQDRKPFEIQGGPLSETIIEERR
jgi:hypothetical protein